MPSQRLRTESPFPNPLAASDNTTSGPGDSPRSGDPQSPILRRRRRLRLLAYSHCISDSAFVYAGVVCGHSHLTSPDPLFPYSAIATSLSKRPRGKSRGVAPRRRGVIDSSLRDFDPSHPTGVPDDRFIKTSTSSRIESDLESCCLGEALAILEKHLLSWRSREGKGTRAEGRTGPGRRPKGNANRQSKSAWGSISTLYSLQQSAGPGVERPCPAHMPVSATRGGRALYELYRAASRAAAPAVLLWRRLRGLEHPSRWPERMGRPSVARPRPGSPLVWFHAVSLGEGMATLTVISHCARLHPGLPILLTTTTLSSFEVIKDLLPVGVIYQFAPLDCPDAIESFIGYWKPSLILLMESELWPNLIMSAAEKGIAVALLNARVSLKSFNRWSVPLGLPLVSMMLSKLSLVIPLSTIQAVRFQLLQTPPQIIHFAGDLKYAAGDVDAGEKEVNRIKDLQQQFSNRPVWMAASIHKGEEEVILRVHDELIKVYPTLLLILVPRHPQDSKNVSLALKKRNVNFVLRSTRQVVSSNTRIYVVDTLGELRMLYRVTPVAVVGGSFLPGLVGHNISEAAAAGCAVLTGSHVGHFYHMLVEMWQINPLAVKQVTGEFELLETLKELFGDSEALGARQRAAKDAFSIMSDGVVNRVWNLVCTFAIGSQKDMWNS